jgi:hypothetical protein
MTNKGKELYSYVKSNFQYELEKVRTDDIRDLTQDIRHIVNNAMKKSIKVYYDYTYEEVCRYLIDEIKV